MKNKLKCHIAQLTKHVSRAASVVATAIVVSVGNLSAQTMVSGKLKGERAAEDQILYVNVSDEKGYQNSRIEVKNGIFNWEYASNTPMKVTFSTEARPSSPNAVATIWTTPGKHSLTLDLENLSKFDFSGTPIHTEASKFASSNTKLNQEMSDLMVEFERVQHAQDEEGMKRVREQYGPLHRKISERNLEYVKANPSSYFAASLLYDAQQSLSLEEQEQHLNMLKGEAKESPYARRIAYDIAGAKGGTVGNTAPLFSGTDINGGHFDLANLIGEKVILVDFWASWCVPCRKGNPHLKELHNKYKASGLEVVLVADNDDSPDEWRKAVAADQIEQFTHILRGWKGMEYFFARDDVSGKYGVRSLPTKFLIDRNGKIIGRYGGGGGSDADLDKKLAEVFGF